MSPIALSIVLVSCFGGALIARLCGQQAVRGLRQAMVDWDSVILWGCGFAAGLCIPTLCCLVIILVLGVGGLGLLAIVVGLVLGLLAPELWTGFSAWLRDPRHFVQAVIACVVVAGVIIVLLNFNLVLSLLGSVLVLAVVLLGLRTMLRPLHR